jgi:hypothetical protein
VHSFSGTCEAGSSFVAFAYAQPAFRESGTLLSFRHRRFSGRLNASSQCYFPFRSEYGDEV